jgi:hypothetical protein
VAGVGLHALGSWGLAARTDMNSGLHSDSLGGLAGGGWTAGVSSTSPAASRTNMSVAFMRSFCTPEGAITILSPAATHAMQLCRVTGGGTLQARLQVR